MPLSITLQQFADQNPEEEIWARHRRDCMIDALSYAMMSAYFDKQAGIVTLSKDEYEVLS